MRVNEIAKKLLVHPVTVRRWCQKGFLKSTLTKPQYGGHLFYDISEENLQDYLKKNENT